VTDGDIQYRENCSRSSKLTGAQLSRVCLLKTVERERGGKPGSAPRDRFRLTVAVLVLDIVTDGR
jgi:hypothetical protein